MSWKRVALLLALLAPAIAIALVGCGEPHSGAYPLQPLVYDTNGGTLEVSSLTQPNNAIAGTRLDISQQALGSSQPILLSINPSIQAPAGFVQVGPCIRVGPAAFGFPVLSRLRIPFDSASLPAGATPDQICVLYQDTFYDPPIALTAQTPHAYFVAPVTTSATTVSLFILQDGLFEAVIPPNQPPSITSVSPNESTTAGGITVVITGERFQSGAVVTVNGIPQDDVQVLGPTTIRFVNSPAYPLTVDVRVQNPDGGKGEKFAAFTYHN